MCYRVRNAAITSIDLRLLAGNHGLTGRLNYRLRTVTTKANLTKVRGRMLPCKMSGLRMFSTPNLFPCASLPRASVLIGLFGRRGPRVYLVNTAIVNHSLKPHMSSTLADKLATSYARLRVNARRSGGGNVACRGLLCRVHPTFNNGVITAVIGPRRHPRVTAIHRKIVGGRVLSRGCGNRIIGRSITGFIPRASCMIGIVSHRMRGTGRGLGNTPVIVTKNCNVKSGRNFSGLFRLTGRLRTRMNTDHTTISTNCTSRSHRVNRANMAIHPGLCVTYNVSKRVRRVTNVRSTNVVVSMGDSPGTPVGAVTSCIVGNAIRRIIPGLVGCCGGGSG